MGRLFSIITVFWSSYMSGQRWWAFALMILCLQYML